ncbi:MAG: HD domain-containing protein [Isosphaeraceae bacterium]|nr:HD domain-containing protein [Isosphaeraceae bacterium]
MRSLRWTDRVYGEVSIDDPGVLALIARPTFQRLRGIRQAGPSALAFPFKTVTRFEHSLGVYLLLRRLGAGREEQLAGLLHDVSHTAFSHAVDFLFDSAEQDHHEGLKAEFLGRPDMAAAIRALGVEPGLFHDDEHFRLLERPLPWLCADRLDYFLRDSLACSVTTSEEAERILDDLVVVDQTIAFQSVEIARLAVERFAEMNRDWWASPTEAFIYNQFADAMREGFRLGVLESGDLYSDDMHVLSCLRSAKSPLIDAAIGSIRGFQSEMLEGFTPKVAPKVRWLDPPVAVGDGWAKFSACESAAAVEGA